MKRRIIEWLYLATDALYELALKLELRWGLTEDNDL